MLVMETDEKTSARSGQGTARSRKSGSRVIASYIPVATAVLGITLVVSSVVFFYVEDDLRRLVSVTLGLAILITGIWFAANPFIHNGRRFITLREEVDGFIDLVRQLNQQALDMAPGEDLENTRVRMHEAVDHMVAEAGRTR